MFVKIMKNNNKISNIVVKIILVVLIIIIIMGYVPIKFAKHTNNLVLIDNEYLCQLRLKTIVVKEKWFVFPSLPIDYSELIHVTISGNIPHNILNPKYFKDYKDEENSYVFMGELLFTDQSTSYRTGTLKIENWDIVYPVVRDSPWNILLPKRYLTIYDFNWCDFLKELLSL